MHEETEDVLILLGGHFGERERVDAEAGVGHPSIDVAAARHTCGSGLESNGMAAPSPLPSLSSTTTSIPVQTSFFE